MGGNLNPNFRSRILKISVIIYCITVCFVLINHFNNELYYERFPGIFAAYVQMVTKGYVSLDYIPLFPLFNNDICIPSGFPSRIQGILDCESYFPNFTSLFLILHYVSDIPIEVLLVLPVGVLFLPISYLGMINLYIPIQKNNPNFILNFLLFIYITIYLGSTKFYGSFYVAPPSLLLVIILFMSIRHLHKENIQSAHLIVFFITVFSLIHYWHSAFMMFFFFIISSFICIFFCYLIKLFNIRYFIFDDLNNLLTKSKFLVLFSTIIFFSFIHLWCSEYAQYFIAEASIMDFFSKILMKFSGEVPFSIPYVFNYKDLYFGNLYFKSILLIYFLSTVLVSIVLLFQFLENKKINAMKIKLSFIFLIAIIISQIMNVFFYYKSGSINFVYVPLFFAFFGICHYNEYYREYKKKDMYKIVLIVLILFLIFVSVLANVFLFIIGQAGETSATKYEDTRGSFNWLYGHMDINKSVVVDFNILGKYIQRESVLSKPQIKYIDLTTYIYGILVGDTKILPSYLSQNYVIIDEATMSYNIPINILESRALIIPLLDSINDNSIQDKIYTDNHISVLLVK